MDSRDPEPHPQGRLWSRSLAALRRHGNFELAARSIGVSAGTLHKIRTQDKVWAQRAHEAIQAWVAEHCERGVAERLMSQVDERPGVALKAAQWLASVRSPQTHSERVIAARETAEATARQHSEGARPIALVLTPEELEEMRRQDEADSAVMLEREAAREASGDLPQAEESGS